MPIQTRGFQLDVMPRFTPVDPSLVALNPDRLQSGILSSLQIRDAVGRIDAYRKLQDELEATRKARIDAANASAQLQAATATRGLGNVAIKGDVDAAEASARLKTLPFATEADIARAKLATGEATSGIGLLPGRTRLAEMNQKLGEMGLQGAIDRAPEENVLLRRKQMLDAIKTESEIELDPRRRDKLLREIDSSLKSAFSDSEVDQALKAAKIKLDNAMAEAAAERASADTKRAEALDNAHKTHAVAISRAQAALRDLNAFGQTEIIDPDTGQPVKISTIESRIFERDDKGEWKPRDKGLWGFKRPLKLAPNEQRAVDAYAEALNDHKAANAFLNRVAKDVEAAYVAKRSGEDSKASDKAVDVPVYGIVNGKYQRIK